MLRILLADDHEVTRKGIRQVLSAFPQWQICGEISNGSDAVEIIKRLAPDIAIIELAMSGINGFDSVRGIKCACPDTEVLIYSVQEDEDSIRHSAEAGALGYVLKSEPSADLIEAVKAVSHRKPFFTPRMRRIFARPNGALGPFSSPLTKREREIIQLLADGKGNREVSVILHISVKTVETHRAIIKRKLGMGSIVDLVHYAVRNNLVQP